MHDQGKVVADRLYLHVSAMQALKDNELATLVTDAIRLSCCAPTVDFNVVRIRRDQQEVALLNYPTFFAEEFPALRHSWRVHIPSGHISFRDYTQSLNPPILHRKELLLAESHPDRATFAAQTAVAESIGLFDDPVRIGFRRQWAELIATKGYAIVEGRLVPAANAGSTVDRECHTEFSGQVERHRTALTRTFLSAPVQALLRHRVLDIGKTFFDYGCGRGDDLAGLRAIGYDAFGWDPHFQPDADRRPCDVVNLGFVINVIENIDERIEALKGAYQLTIGALSVAAILLTSSGTRGRPYGDGVLTSRNTFQRFFSQGELQVLIEEVLDEQAFPVAPGIFFVFRDRYMEQRFLASRQVDPTRAPRLLAARETSRSLTASRRTQGYEVDQFRMAALTKLWDTSIEFGRIPEPDEYPDAARAIELFGTWKRALAMMQGVHEMSVLERAAAARMEEVSLFFAMQAFERRRNRALVDSRLKRDVRAFFGSVAAGDSAGLELLKRSAETSEIKGACERAAADGLGWLDRDHSFQLHTSLVKRLPAVLRAYVGCATTLYGDVGSTDLIKIHIQSGKITLMRFDDFDGSPVPLMLERVKIKLREQQLDLFEYGEHFPPPPLYFKSRFINEEYSRYPEQLEFDSAVEALGIVQQIGYGPTQVEFSSRLRLCRKQIVGMRLEPATDIPPLDQLCGRTFTYRQLIECGETWERTKVANTPLSAESFNALYDLATQILDPVVEYFGGIRLTYAFAGPGLTRKIAAGIAPHLDQHASFELNTRGNRICTRGGAAVDLLVQYENMREVADWIADKLPFDRLYFYGSDRPIHVSIGPEQSRSYIVIEERNGRRLPRKGKRKSPPQ